jgi:hypothetical protein
VTSVWDAYYHFPTNVLTIAQPEPYHSIKIPYSILPCNETWSNDKPHVIYGYVVVDSACSLSIPQGTQIHVHKGGGIWVYRDGQIQVGNGPALGPGTMDLPVVIQGDRLEPSYSWVPGQWGGVLGGIFLMRSNSIHTFQNTLIKNATTAIRLDSAASISATNVIVSHSSRVNLYGGFGYASLDNFISGPAGVYGFYALGGSYSARNSTFLNTWGYSTRGGTAVGLSNFFEDGNGVRYFRPVEASFSESIIDGSLSSEVSMAIDANEIFNVTFSKSALTIEPNPEAGHYSLSDTNMFLGTENIFNGTWNYKRGILMPIQSLFPYVPDSLSPLIHAVEHDPNGPTYDIHGVSRPFMSTIGASEPD